MKLKTWPWQTTVGIALSLFCAARAVALPAADWLLRSCTEQQLNEADFAAFKAADTGHCQAMRLAVGLALDLAASPVINRSGLSKRVTAIQARCSVEVQVVIPERLRQVEDRIAIDLDLMIRWRQRPRHDQALVAIATQRSIFLPLALNGSHYLGDQELNGALHSFEAIAMRMERLLGQREVIQQCVSL